MDQMDFMFLRKNAIMTHPVINKKGKDFMDLLEMLQPAKQKDYFSDRSLARVHSFYLSGTITSADDYIDWFDIIRSAGENDVIKIHINSYGGDLFTAIQMMRVLGECQGTVVVSVEGACMSAATMIFMHADAFEVSPHSMFMFHNYSGGTFGKGGEMLDQLQHERAWSEKLLRDIYSDFLDEKEIESMLNNKDIWMDGDEVVKRLEKKAKKVRRNAKASD
jgi:ATP-dependent protease ClpP protease subunit